MNEQEFRTKLAVYNASVARKIKENNAEIEKLDAGNKALYSRQLEEDRYTELYQRGSVLKPPYAFSFLQSLYEESDVLQGCVSAMIKNVVGMGYTFNYLGDDNLNIPSEAQAELELLKGFFSQTNEEEGWRDIMTKAWEDYEVLGNLAIEVVRNLDSRPGFAYYHPMETLRLGALSEDDFMEVPCTVIRGGKQVTIPVVRAFRRYLSMTYQGTLRYYKTFGDPRPLRVDGTYTSNAMLASEIIWISNRSGVMKYGLPRWIGCTFDVAGRRDAQALNWDLLRSQGVSPMAILVEGKLSDDSWDEIWNMIMGAKGIENFNKVWVLQVSATATGVGQKSSTSIKIQDLSGIQKSDQMFSEYLKATEERVRMAFRIPAGFIGNTGAYSYGTMRVAKTLGEEQVFAPERMYLDNKINRLILQQGFSVYNWQYKSKAAEVAGPEEIRNAITSLTNAGALSINNAVNLANDALGRTFSEFSQPWAKYPMPLLLKILDKIGDLKGLEDVTDGPTIKYEDLILTDKDSPF